MVTQLLDSGRCLEAQHERLDLVVNNAGMMLRSRQVTSEGVDMMLAINRIAPYLLTNPLFRPARAFCARPDRHRRLRWTTRWADSTSTTSRPRAGLASSAFPRYSETKLMNVMFTSELARRVQGTVDTANCLHPGEVATNLRDSPVFVRLLLRVDHRRRSTRCHLAVLSTANVCGRSTSSALSQDTQPGPGAPHT